MSSDTTTAPTDKVGEDLTDEALENVRGGTINFAFNGLPIGDLIGGPLASVNEQQNRLANTTADFIARVGTTGTGN